MRRALRGLVLVLAMVVPVVGAEEKLPPFPDFTLTNLDDGSRLTVSAMRGKPVLLTFWASWCGPCRVELPELQKLHEELKDRGFRLVTVNVDTSTAAARRFLELTRLKIPVYRMDQRDLMTIGVASLPTNVLLDPEGRPAKLYEGYSPTVPAALRELVLGMLNRKKEP